MNLEIFRGILIPFLGTTLGAACVFFMKRSLSSSIQRALTGFAAGIMTAASVWSLLIPAMALLSSSGQEISTRPVQNALCSRYAF